MPRRISRIFYIHSLFFSGLGRRARGGIKARGNKNKRGQTLEVLPSFDMESNQLLILETEGYGEVEVASHSNTVVFTGLPSRHLLHHSDSLAVEVAVNALDNSNVADRAVFFNHELHDHTTLDVILLGRFGIADVVAEELHQRSLTTGEFSLLLNSHEDLFFFRLGLFGFRFFYNNLLVHCLELIGIVRTLLVNDTAGGVVFLLGIHIHNLVFHFVGVDDGDLGNLH